MKYINKKDKQLIIDVPVNYSTTKITAKDGTTKDNIKYIAHIPNEILIFLLERFKPFDAANCTDADYIDGMLKINDKENKEDKIYLSFYNHPGEDHIEMMATKEKFIKPDCVSVTVKKRVKSNSYFFTVSKKVFSQLKNCYDCNFKFRYVLSFDSDSYCFKNSVVDVVLV